MKQNTFKTKLGYCHIVDNKLVMSKEEDISDLNNLKNPIQKTRSLIVVGIMIASMVGFYIYAYIQKDDGAKIMATLLTIASMLLGLSVIQNSDQNIIPKNKITGIKYSKALNGITRASYTVSFTDNKGKNAKSVIVLPGTLGDGRKIAAEAHKIMKANFPKFIK